MTARLRTLCAALLLGAATVHCASISRTVPCEPGELVFVECNLCTCNPQGYPNAVCARMWCQPPPRNKLMDNNDIVSALGPEQDNARPAWPLETL